MSKLVFRSILSILLIAFPTVSLQAQLCGPHRVKLFTQSCTDDVYCCPTASNVVVSCQDGGSVPIDHCEATKTQDTTLIEKYFKDESQLSFLRTLVDSRCNRCRAGMPIDTPLSTPPDNAEACWRELQACLNSGNHTKEYCEDKFFSCLRALDQIGIPIPCPTEYSSVICCEPIFRPTPHRRCFGLFSRLSRLRCR